MRLLKAQSLFAAFLAFALAGCSSGPDDRVEGFYHAVSNNETGEALEYVDPGLTQAFGAKISASIARDYEKSKKKGGLLSLDTSSQIEGDRAKVNVTATYGDGSTQDTDLKMRKIDGEWYITM